MMGSLWWGYAHKAGTVHVKRFQDCGAITDAQESPFVADVFAPFFAADRIESGKKSPSLHLLSKYSDFFKIPMSSILLFSEQINTGQNKTDKIKQVVADKILKVLKF